MGLSNRSERKKLDLELDIYARMLEKLFLRNDAINLNI